MFKFKIYSNNNDDNQYQECGYSKGLVDRDTLDESLSETQVTYLSTSSAPLVPLSHIRIDVEGDLEDGSYGMVDMIYRVVVNDEVSQITFKGSSNYYEHTLTIDEESKILERYNVDNLSFTNLYEDNEKMGEGLHGYEYKTDAYNTSQIYKALSEYTPSNPSNYIHELPQYPYYVIQRALQASSIASEFLTILTNSKNNGIQVSDVSNVLRDKSNALVMADRLMAGYNFSQVMAGLSYKAKGPTGLGTADLGDRIMPVKQWGVPFGYPTPAPTATLFSYDFSNIKSDTTASAVPLPVVTIRSSTVPVWFGSNSPLHTTSTRQGMVNPPSGEVPYGPCWNIKLTENSTVSIDSPYGEILAKYQANDTYEVYLQKYVYGAFQTVSANLYGRNSVQISEEGVYRFVIKVSVKYKPAISISVPKHLVQGQSWTMDYAQYAETDNEFVLRGEVYSPSFNKGVVEESVISGISLADVTNRVCNLSARRTLEKGTNRFMFNPQDTNLARIDAPEMIITNKNLWEALKMIGSYANCIPYLRDSTVYMLNLNDVKSVPDKFKRLQRINYSSKYSANDYTGALDVTVDNLISDFYDGAGMDTEGNYAFTSETIEITQSSDNTLIIGTKYPIYRLNSVYPITCIDPNGDEYPIIGKMVKELSLYNALSLVEQSSCLYFEQGQKGIHGLQFKVSKDFESDASTNVSTIYNVLHAAGVPDTYNNADSIFQLSFRITYVPVLSARLKYYKSGFLKKFDSGVASEIFQNASSNVLDSKQVGRTMVNALSRMGNPTYTEVYKVLYPIEGLEVGQRNSDGYIISIIDREFHTRYIIYTVHFVKDFHCLNQYLAVHNEQRYYEVSEKQSLDRYVTTPCYYLFSKSNKEVHEENAPYILGDSNLLLLTLNPGYYHGDNVNYDVKASRVSTYGKGVDYLSYTTEDYVSSGVTYHRYIFLFSDGSTYTVDGIGNDIYNVADVQVATEGGFWHVYIYTPHTNGQGEENWELYGKYNTEKRYGNYLLFDGYLPTLSIASGNTINYITDFEDNYSAGNQSIDFKDQYQSGSVSDGDAYIKYHNDNYYIPVPVGNTYQTPTYKRKSSNYVQGLLKQACPYGDVYGKIDYINVKGVVPLTPPSKSDSYKVKSNILARTLPAIGYYSTSSDGKLVFHEDTDLMIEQNLGDTPSTNTPSYVFTGCNQQVYVDKDSREVIHINQQHHFISDDSSIIVGPAMTEMSPFISSKRKYQYPRIVFLNRKLVQGDDIISDADIVNLDNVTYDSYTIVKEAITPPTVGVRITYHFIQDGNPLDITKSFMVLGAYTTDNVEVTVNSVYLENGVWKSAVRVRVISEDRTTDMTFRLADILQRYRCVSSGESTMAQEDVVSSLLNCIDTASNYSKINTLQSPVDCEAWAIVMYDSIGEDTDRNSSYRLVVGCNESLKSGDWTSAIYMNKCKELS